MLKCVLVKDKKHVSCKSKDWLHILIEVLEICVTRSGVEEEELIQEMIVSKTKRLDAVIAFC